ncbi:hypothetical protein CU098_010379 [Rhizopus stolonifer]|uniref:DUF8032 domain-containing protein n=1 Tax=Rhizopus stolonifer TaxID=4846 RepID=A0A367JYJ9_RHIST|nr:hypothetical protein CU098_010379 [Rhizopus stolonifer]
MMDNSYVTQDVNDKNSLKNSCSRQDSYSSVSTDPTSYDKPSNHLNMTSSMVQPNIWRSSTTSDMTLGQTSHTIIHPLESNIILQSWNTAPDFPNQVKLEQAWRMESQPSSFIHTGHHPNYELSSIMPQTPTSSNYVDMLPMHHFGLSDIHSTPPVMDNTSNHNVIFTPPPPTNTMPVFLDSKAGRRNSSAEHRPHKQRVHGKRSSSQPSVASVVSLTAHEPVSKIIHGIEHITFLYSHDRLVKEYTVRTDVDSVDLDDIAMEFRIQNAIYPRANVDRSEYDGNRWDYETTCNQLGWKICWLNKEQLFGRRGLIQRAVDSYRNRHADMRSRRVARQEKVANGTLRKRRSKKFSTPHLPI